MASSQQPPSLDQRVAQRLGQLSLQILSMQVQIEEFQSANARLSEEKKALIVERDQLLDKSSTQSHEQK